MAIVAVIRNEITLLRFALRVAPAVESNADNGESYPYHGAAVETRVLAFLLLVSILPDVFIAHLFLNAHRFIMWTLDGVGAYLPLRAFGALHAYRLRPHRHSGAVWTLRKGTHEVRIASDRIISARTVERDAVREARRGECLDLTVSRENVVELSLRGTHTLRVLVSADYPVQLCIALLSDPCRSSEDDGARPCHRERTYGP